MRVRIADLAEGIASRDWVLSGHRPKNSGESHSEAQLKRSQLYASRQQSEVGLHELQSKYAALDRERTDVRNELFHLEQAAITPERLQSEINQHQADLLDVQGKQKSLATTLGHAIKLRDQADKAEQDEVVATEMLHKARTDLFFATSQNEKTLDAVIAETEVATNLARERAMTARAARPVIVTKIEEATAALESFTEGVTRLEQAIEQKQNQQRKLVAHDRWAEIIDQARLVVHNLLKADPAAGKVLAKALASDGLRAFDRDGRLCRPDWLKHGSNGIAEF